MITTLTNYGAPELKKSYRDHLTFGLLISLILHVAGLIVYWTYAIYWAPQEHSSRTVKIQLMKYPELYENTRITYQAPQVETNTVEQASPAGIPSEIPEIAALAGSSGVPARMDLAAELDDLGMGQTVAAPPRVASRGTGITDTRVVTRDIMPALKETDTTFDGDLNLDGPNSATTLPGHSRGRGFGGSSKNSNGILPGSGGNSEAGIGSGALGNGAVDAGLGVPGGTDGGSANRGASPGRSKASEASARVRLKGLDDFGDYRNFTPIYRTLVEWMRRHPATLSDVVNRFMGYQSGNLTASEKFVVSGRRFEIFLLCVEATYEIRVCMVEGSDITYLIDQGFKKQSNYLRTGALNREPNGNILLFGSVMREASDRRAQEFYQIFLSWWETVKHEVGG